MGTWLFRRVCGALAVIVALILFTFFATNMIGDPIALLADPELATEEDLAALRAEAGLDRPLPERFVTYVGDVIRGDFGTSLWQQRPASELVLERAPATLLLAGVTVVFSVLVAVALSVIAVRKSGHWVSHAIFVVSAGLACVPSFWLAILLIIGFAVKLSIFPTSGYGSPIHLVLPVLALSAQPIGHFTQVLTTGMNEQIREQYVQTARAKGLTDRAVMIGHVFRNTSILATTMIGSMIAALMNGAVLAEAVFAWPGLGDLGLQAVHNRDLPVLTAVVFYAGVAVTLVNVAVDAVYMRLDPRIGLK
jgi:peptide/nickel transport system permease protein